MISGFFFLLTVIVTGVYFKNYAKRIVLDHQAGKYNKVLIGSLIFIIGLFVTFVQPFKIERVDAGHVGIKINLVGDSRGVGRFEYKTGWVIYNSWISKVHEFPTFQQHIEYDEQQVITKGGFASVIRPSFNYSLKPGEVGDMFQNLRLNIKEIEQQWLKTAIVGTVNDVANKWVVDDIFNHREQFESDIIVEANKRVSKWFTISQLRTNITPPPALQKAIEAKTKAIQEVQVAENQKLVAIAEGDRQIAEAIANGKIKIAKAKADSASRVIEASSIVIEATAEAKAIKIKQLSLTKEYIEYLKVQKWDGSLPKVQSGTGGLLMQIDTK